MAFFRVQMAVQFIETEHLHSLIRLLEVILQSRSDRPGAPT